MFRFCQLPLKIECEITLSDVFILQARMACGLMHTCRMPWLTCHPTARINKSLMKAKAANAQKKRADNVPREQALSREAHHDTRAPQRNTCSIRKAVVSRRCSCSIRSRMLLPCQPVVKFRSQVEYKIANRMCPYCGHERHVA